MNRCLVLSLLLAPIGGAALALADVGSLSPIEELGPSLRIELLLAVEAPLAAGDVAPLEIWLVNEGSEPVSLVEPGDGSTHGWRTPLVQWLVGRRGEELGPPELLPRCGNMNPLQASEVFALQPGERRKLSDWTGGPSFPETGIWSVRLRYRNDPKQPWRDERDLDPAIVQRVQQSTAVDLVSNQIELVVLDAPQ